MLKLKIVSAVVVILKEETGNKEHYYSNHLEYLALELTTIS